jgi:hypothetical protein
MPIHSFDGFHYEEPIGDALLVTQSSNAFHLLLRQDEIVHIQILFHMLDIARPRYDAVGRRTTKHEQEPKHEQPQIRFPKKWTRTEAVLWTSSGNKTRTLFPSGSPIAT